MKTLQISQSAQDLDRASRSLSAIPSVSDKVCISVAIVAVVVMFAALGLMCVPAIVASGLTALSAVAIAPSMSKKGGQS